jgi:hypothetical protein
MVQDVQRNGISDDRRRALRYMRVVKVTVTGQYGQDLVLKKAQVYAK